MSSGRQLNNAVVVPLESRPGWMRRKARTASYRRPSRWNHATGQKLSIGRMRFSRSRSANQRQVRHASSMSSGKRRMPKRLEPPTSGSAISQVGITIGAARGGAVAGGRQRERRRKHHGAVNVESCRSPGRSGAKSTSNTVPKIGMERPGVNVKSRKGEAVQTIGELSRAGLESGSGQTNEEGVSQNTVKISVEAEQIVDRAAVFFPVSRR